MGRRELEEESKERKRGERTEGRLGVQAVWRLHRHTCYPSAGEKGRVFFLGGAQEEREGVVKLLSSLSASVPGYCLFTAMADRHMNVWQGRQKEC